MIILYIQKSDVMKKILIKVNLINLLISIIQH